MPFFSRPIARALAAIDARPAYGRALERDRRHAPPE